MPIKYATALDIGNRKRDQGGINEDSVAVNLTDEGHLDTGRQAGVFVLADGAGGEEAGEVASYIATVEVTRRLARALWDTRRFDTNQAEAEASDDGRWLDETVVHSPLAMADPDWLLSEIDDAI